MKTPKKAVVTKKLSEETLLNAKRWTAFCEASRTPWDDLSPEFKDFFYAHGKTCDLEVEELNEFMDRAMGEPE